VDSVDSEALGEGAYDSEALGEGAYDSEALGEGAYDSLGEESRAARRQRERQRQIMLARQRQLRRQQPPGQGPRPVPPPGQRQAITAIRSLDLETKVSQDSLRRALEASNRRAARATWAAVASAAVDQGLDSFGADLDNHEYIKAGARFAPLLFLSPEKTKRGVEGFVTDPRVIGGAAILSIALLGNFRTRSQGIASLSIVPPSGRIVAPDVGTSTGTITANALDRHGKLVSSQPAITWSSSDPGTLAFLDPNVGTFTLTAGNTGTVQVTAQGGGFSDRLDVQVTGKWDAIARIRIVPPSGPVTAPAAGTTTGTITANALDEHGNVLITQPAITWSSSDPATLKFTDPSMGTYTLTAGATGRVQVTAQGGGFSGQRNVRVK
ncbi:MAG TPA: Ig-like domain-containing protein, partial [Streptosporangiaceae bacterium]